MRTALRTITTFTCGFGIFAALGAACGGDQAITATVGSGVGGGTTTSGTGGDGGGLTFSAGVGGAPECSVDGDCGDGVCNQGSCCASADAVCEDTCCGTGEACLFGQCLVLGNDCVSQADCGEDEYCEPALGEPSGQGGSGAGCTQPLTPGKCVPKPPTCDDAPNDPDCIEACEYIPPVGQLTAVTKWQWGYDPAPTEFAGAADVWSTPMVARIIDANCDGSVDLADPPNIVFVSGDAQGTFCSNNNTTNFACRKGVLRVLDGRTGAEAWSLDKAEMTSEGFAGLSVALGDVDNDQQVDIVALTGEGKLAVINREGTVTHLSTEIVDGNTAGGYGWGGGLAIADMDEDGWVEIAYGRTVFTMQNGTLAHLFTGTGGRGGSNANQPLSYFADVTGDSKLELIAGNTAYGVDGMAIWTSTAPDGFTAVADLYGDATPEIVNVSGGNLRILNGSTGAVEIGPHDIPGSGSGGPPTIADFNGDGEPEIGVAMQNFYSMMKPDIANTAIIDQWSTRNHDNSSSVTGSSVFDFQGDGKAEVVYMDECFLWVYDGTTGDVIFTTNSQSFTATEAAIVADVDGDGHAEIVMVHNAANPNGTSWSCAEHVGDAMDPYPAWSPPAAGNYRGITVLGDSANSWVGTRTLWNQHAYSVSNVCDPRDTACAGQPYYGQIPLAQTKNWTLGWLNNFRQNVQDGSLFDAPDPIVTLDVACLDPVPMEITVRNIGLSGLPANVEVGIFKLPNVQVGSVFTTKALLPGQTEVLTFTADAADANSMETFYAEIVVDPNAPTFNECRPENNKSANVKASCVN